MNVIEFYGVIIALLGVFVFSSNCRAWPDYDNKILLKSNGCRYVRIKFLMKFNTNRILMLSSFFSKCFNLRFNFFELEDNQIIKIF